MLIADQAREQGDIATAINSYSDALEIYNDLSLNFPEEQKETVKFRTLYCNNQLEKMLKEADRVKMIKEKETQGKVSSSDEREKLSKLVKTAQSYILNKQPEEARSILMSAISLDPDNTELRLLMGIAQCQAGKYEDALFILDYLVEENPDNLGALIALSSVYLARNDSSTALRKMELALSIAPENPEVNFNMAQLLLAVDPPNPEESMKYYKKAISLGAETDEELEGELKKF